MTPLRTLVWLTASISLIQHAWAFAPARTLHTYNHDVLISPCHETIGLVPPLFYRPLDKDDDESMMLKTSTRAPIFYNMREAIAKRTPKTAMNIPLIRALLANQGAILSIATAITYGLLFFTDGFEGIGNIRQILHWTDATEVMDLPISVAFGTLGALLMLFISNKVETSDRPEFANVNFSTILMSMTLFGRRRAPPEEMIPPEYRGQPVATTRSFDAALQSLGLAVTTGICEESVFRQQVPALIAHYTGDTLLLPLFGQAVLFGLGHVSRVSIVENAIVIGLQTINGIIHGLLYVASGGSLIPCILAHAIYDFVVFFKTWSDANDQIEYADKMSLQPLGAETDKQVKQALGKTRLDPKMFQLLKRLFYTFDFDKNETLSLSEVRKGFAYMAIERAGTPPPQAKLDAAFRQVIPQGDDRMSFPDFLRLFEMTRKKKPAPGAAVAA